MRASVLGGALATVLAVAAPAHAGHSVTELYNPFYVVGVTLVVVLSFAIVVLVVRHASTLASWPTLLLSSGEPRARVGVARVAIACARCVSVLGLLLVIVAGLFGHHIASWNPAPKLVWVVAWVLIPAAQLLVGNVWAMANPWLVLFEWAERLFGTARSRVRYPAVVGLWPAVATFVVLAWWRVSSGTEAEPRVIGGVVLVYSLVTWAGMTVFGKHVWLHRAECLTVFYSLLAAAAPTALRVLDTTPCATCPLDCAECEACVDCPRCYALSRRRSLALRPWAVGLLARPLRGVDGMVFVLVMLATGMFGGLLETRAWERLGVTLGVPLAPSARTALVAAAALLIVVVVTLAMYALACAIVRATSAASRSTADVALAFAAAMIPLAAGFHLTHGVDHTFEDTQRLLRLLSDPLGLGWNVLGTRMWPVVPASPRVVWSVQLIAIVAAHVAGVYVAHVRALAVYPDRRTAIYSQVPMVAVIILFTVSGLWILTRIPMVL